MQLPSSGRAGPSFPSGSSLSSLAPRSHGSQILPPSGPRPSRSCCQSSTSRSRLRCPVLERRSHSPCTRRCLTSTTARPAHASTTRASVRVVVLRLSLTRPSTLAPLTRSYPWPKQRPWELPSCTSQRVSAPSSSRTTWMTTPPCASMPRQSATSTWVRSPTGTTFIFTNYLSVAVPTWKSKVGAGKSVNWPVGLGGSGNAGVAGLVSQHKGAVGYVDLVYAVSSKLPFATMRNSSGNFIVASLASSGRAAQIQLPDDLKVLLMNSSDAQAYPIAAFTWLLAYREQKYADRTLGQAIALKRLLNWMLTTAQSVNEGLGYGTLPATAVTKAQALVKSMTYGGAPIPD